MKRVSCVALAAVLSLALAGMARAQDAKAVVDKAIKAAGGEEKLAKAGTVSWKTKGSISFGENESDFDTHLTAQGLDHYRLEATGNFNGNEFRAVTVIAGDKVWRIVGDMPLNPDLANEKRNAYLQFIPVTLVALKGTKFKVESAGEETIAGKPASTLKVTGPEGKAFKLSFDKETGLPVKLAAEVIGFQGQEYILETTYSNYKDFDGIKKATKVESKRDGQSFQKYEVTEFKVLEKAPPETFAEPK